MLDLTAKVSKGDKVMHDTDVDGKRNTHSTTHWPKAGNRSYLNDMNDCLKGKTRMQ